MKNKKIINDNEIEWESVLSSQKSFDDFVGEKKYKQSFLEDIYDFFAYTIPYHINNLRYEFKMKYQLLTKGYNDRQVWGFKLEMAELTIKLLTELSDGKVGYPYGLTQKKWDKILAKIILGFKAQQELDAMWDLDKKLEAKLEKQWKEGMALYTEWYGNLWD